MADADTKSPPAERAAAAPPPSPGPGSPAAAAAAPPGSHASDIDGSMQRRARMTRKFTQLRDTITTTDDATEVDPTGIPATALAGTPPSDAKLPGAPPPSHAAAHGHPRTAAAAGAGTGWHRPARSPPLPVAQAPPPCPTGWMHSPTASPVVSPASSRTV